MFFRRRLPLFFAAAACASGTALAQEARIDRARQLDSLSNILVRPIEPVVPSALEVSRGADAESFGIQQLLREAERVRPFRVYADATAFATDNVALARSDRHSDVFFVATFGFEYRRPLPHGFQFETTFRFTTFRYDEFRQLDFNSIDVTAGITYHSKKLGGIDFVARYGFNQLTTAAAGDEFFTNHTIQFGVQKVVPLGQTQYVYVGAAAQLGFADPKESERSEFSVFAGYHVQAMRNLEADLLYRYAYYHYTEGGRGDHNQAISAGLKYRFTDWFVAGATSYVSWNRSNQEAFNYDAANCGVGLTLSFQF